MAIIPDLLGFGLSAVTKNYSPSKIILHALDLINNLGIDKNLKIVGASMGGSRALKFANEKPNLIDKITFLTCWIIWRSKYSFPLNQTELLS